jgi:hypothetical protein
MVRHRIVNPPRKQLGVRVPPLQPISLLSRKILSTNVRFYYVGLQKNC